MTAESIGDTDKVAPGEGERRAQRGYVPQYELGARSIYEALAAGKLRWVGLADRGAGTFDDLVLGLHDRIRACQVKTSRDPEPFSIRTALLGAENLLKRMLDARRNLSEDNPGALIETHYICDDYPRADDKVSPSKKSASSAAFIRTHEAYRSSWSLDDWRASPFAIFVADVQAASELDDAAFETAWRNMRFLVGGQSRSGGAAHYGSADRRRVRELASLLPKLVADPSDRDRWPVEEILSRLGWRDPFELRHAHVFPVDALYQSNAPTEDALQRALASTTSGYISLVGPPGSGKSTLLAAGLLPTPRAAIARYLAFVPSEAHGLGRAEAFDFLSDIVRQLKQQGLGATVMPGSELSELRAQFEMLLGEAAHRFQSEQVRTLIVVDGLDHVPREEMPERSFLREFPLPHAVPDGAIFILGTQRLDLEGIPRAVRDQAGRSDRCVPVSPLAREAVSQWADVAGVPGDIDRAELYSHTNGHPLSTRYVIQRLLTTPTPEDRREWLNRGPTYGGDVNVFYERAWHDLEGNAAAQSALAYVAIAEAPIRPVFLDHLVGTDATDAAWNAAEHLLARDRRNNWSIFHNSFRLFLRARSSLRHGEPDVANVRRRYGKLAETCEKAESDDPQRWLELRYRARAGDHAAVAQLARPERFRKQFIEGRNPGDICDDIEFALGTAGVLRQPELIIDLILSRHEIGMRADALVDDIFDAFIALGDLEAARSLLWAEGASVSTSKGYELVDVFLESGDAAEARDLFQQLEPLEELLGSRPIEHASNREELEDWAERALEFREPKQFLAVLGRIRRDTTLAHNFDLNAFRTRLKLLAARGQLSRKPDLAPDTLLEVLELDPKHQPMLLIFAARFAFESGNDEVVQQQLEAALPLANYLGSTMRREAAGLASRIDRLDLVAAYLESVDVPSFSGRDVPYGDELRRIAQEIIKHSALHARLGNAPVVGATPDSPLIRTLQSRLEALGRLLGDGRAKRIPTADPMAEFRDILDFLEHGEDDRGAGSERWRVDGVMSEVVTAIVEAAAAIDRNTFSEFTTAMDARLEGNPRRLGRFHVRRAYAMAAFRHDHDADKAVRRLAWERQQSEATPAEQLSAAAQAATAFATFGLHERAREALVEMHSHGLGYSRPPKKDAQYVFWRDVLGRACAEDPAGRANRLRFYGRLLDGMAETEGRGAGARLVCELLEQSAQAGAAWARAAADRIEETGLASWFDLVSGLLLGLVKRRPEFAAAAGIVFGRVALPFTTEYDESIYSQLISAAPPDQLEGVVNHALTCLETDGHPARRVELLQEVIDAAALRGVDVGMDVVRRWRAELPARRSDSSPEDRFAEIDTLEEFASELSRSDDERAWGAARAFARIAPKSDYDVAKALFENTDVLQNDESVIEAMAKFALGLGRREDAVRHLDCMSKLARDRGGWGGGWTGDAKLRLYRVRVALEGEAARRAAFEEFVADLAQRRESIELLLPGLCDVLEVLSPRALWAQVWVRLQGHLSHFREYKIGRDLAPADGTVDAPEHIFADILFRASDTTGIELAHMTRTAAGELTHAPNGPAVVAQLLKLLWQCGGRYDLEAARIVWECRDNSEVRDATTLRLQEMANSDDYAIRLTAISLGRNWGHPCEFKHAPLPAFYSLELPPNPEAIRFEPPSGVSSASAGLWTEDPFAWTWPLEDSLNFTVKASGMEMVTLRTRAAQFMARMGGAETFGPSAVERQLARLRRLGLLVPYRKLSSDAAFRAMREVVGELVAADAIDTSRIPFILRRAGAFDPSISTAPPSPRPVGVPRVIMPDDLGPSRAEDWRAAAEEDAVVPCVQWFIVLAATAIYEHHHFKDRWTIEQYFGPNSSIDDRGLLHQLQLLPRILIAGKVCPLYDGFAQGAVAHPVPDVAESVRRHMVMLCPRVATAVGWRSDSRDPFTYRTDSGDVAAQTLWWRDGGVVATEVDRALVGQGYVLLVSENCLEDLRPHISPTHVAVAWRATEKVGEDKRNVACSKQTVEPR